MTVDRDRAIVALGIDPGAHAGIALVSLAPHTRKATLIAAWPIWGTWPGPWYMRVKRALREARSALIQSRDRAELDYISAWIEEPPVTSRKGTLKGDKKGQVTWAGMGRRQGALMVACYDAGLGWPEQIQNSVWRKLMRCPAKPKKNPTQRTIERAGARVSGAKERLTEILEDRPLEATDCAEAIMIAAARALHFRRTGK